MRVESPVSLSVNKRVSTRRRATKSITKTWTKFEPNSGYATDLFNWIDTNTTGRFIICTDYVAFELEADALMYGLCK